MTIQVWPPAPPPFVASMQYFKPRPRSRLDDDGERGPPALTFSEGTCGAVNHSNRRTSLGSNDARSARCAGAIPREHHHSGQFPGVVSSSSGVQMEWGGRPTI